jgi:mono/diheme cytochrome c family protein
VTDRVFLRGLATLTTASIAMGDSIFHANACARCHGPTAHGAANGPTLVKGDSAKWLHSNGSYEGIIKTITTGVPKDSLSDKTRRFQMNPRGSSPPISDDAVKPVAGYIWKLNHP